MSLPSPPAPAAPPNAPVHELRERAVEKGMRTLLDNALDKARSGTIPVSEVLRTVPYRMLEDRPGSRRAA